VNTGLREWSVSGVKVDCVYVGLFQIVDGSFSFITPYILPLTREQMAHPPSTLYISSSIAQLQVNIHLLMYYHVERSALNRF
jgi:hypothetical protein